MNCKNNIKKAVVWIVIATFLWSNLLWAGVAHDSDTLAPSSNLPVLYQEAAVDLIALDVIHTLASKDAGNIKVFYEREIEEKIREKGANLRCFGIRDMSGKKGKWAFYVVDLENNKFSRFVSDEDVNDRFFHILNAIEKPKVIDETAYGKEEYEITCGTRPFIEKCLDRIYPVKKTDYYNVYKKWAVETIEDIFSKIKYMGDNTLFSLFLAQTSITPGWFSKAKEENRWDEILLYIADSSFLDRWYLEKLRADGKINIDSKSLERLICIVEEKRKIIRVLKSKDLGWVEKAAPELAGKNLVYISPEAKLLGGLKSLFSGGLGVLAGELLVGFGDIGMNTYGVTQLFKNALVQEIDEEGNQVMSEVPVDYSVLPIKDTGEVVDINIGKKKVKAKIWELREGQARIFLLDTDIEGNSKKYREITEVLYGGNRERHLLRMMQNIVLGRGALLIFEKMRIPIGFLHLNEAHTVISAYDLQKKRDNSLFKDTKVIFTTHTSVEFGLPKFELELESLIDPDINKVREYFFRGNKLDFAYAGLKTADIVNAVSQEHRDVTVRRWAQDYRDSLIGITNGVDVPYWQMPGIKAMSRLADAKKDAKRELLDEVKKRTNVELSGKEFTIVISRRITAYKNTMMILQDLNRLGGIINSFNKPVQIIFAGSSHPMDKPGQEMIRNINNILKKERFRGKIVFVPNYNAEFAKLAVRGADVWLSNPVPEEEACATSYAKALKNGTVVISTYTGGPIEHMAGLPLDFDPDSGAVGEASGFFIQPYGADTLYRCIEKARDLYYGYPEVWLKMMRNARKSRVDIRDAAREYARKAFLASLLKDSFNKEAEIFGMEPVPRNEVIVCKGESDGQEITVKIRLGSIKPEYVDVNIYYGPEGRQGWEYIKMGLVSKEEGVFLYKAKIPVNNLSPSRYAFTTMVSLLGLKEDAFTKWHSWPGNDGVIVIKEAGSEGKGTLADMGGLEPQEYSSLNFINMPSAVFEPNKRMFDIEGRDVSGYLDKRLDNVKIESNISKGMISHATAGSKFHVNVKLGGISQEALGDVKVMVRSNMFSFDEEDRYIDDLIADDGPFDRFTEMSKRDREFERTNEDSWEIEIPCKYCGNFYLTIYVVDTVTGKRIWLGGDAHLTVFPDWLKGSGVAVTSLRHMREKDPENRDRLGTFTDLIWDIREKAEQGFNALLLLPLTASIDSSPYEQISPFALNPEHIDWDKVNSGPKAAPEDENEAKMVLEQVDKNLEFNLWLNEQKEKGVYGDFLEYAKLKAINGLMKKGIIILEKEMEMKRLLEEDVGEKEKGHILSYFIPVINKLKSEVIRRYEENVLFKGLVRFALYEQFIAQKQLRGALEVAEYLGIKILFDQPFFPCSEGAISVFHPETIQWMKKDVMKYAGWPGDDPDRYTQHWYNLAKWNFDNSLETIVKPFVYWLNFGFGGFRWDAAHYGNYKLWKLLRDKYMQGKPIFPLCEQLGGIDEAWRLLDEMGYIVYRNTDFFRDSLKTLEEALIHESNVPCFVTADTNDSPRLYELFKHYFKAGLGENPDPILVNKAMLTEYAFAGSIFCMISGAEYGNIERINTPGVAHDWKGQSPHADGQKRGDLRKFVQKLNELRHTHPAMKAYGNLITLDNNPGNEFKDGGGISTLARVHEKGSLVLVNNLSGFRQTVNVNIPFSDFGINPQMPFTVKNVFTGEEKGFILDEKLSFDLGPGECVILEFLPQPIDSLSLIQLQKLIYGDVKDTFVVVRYGRPIYTAPYKGLLGLKFIFDEVKDTEALNYHIEKGHFCSYLMEKVLIGDEFRELRKWFFYFYRVRGSNDEKREVFQRDINAIIKHVEDILVQKISAAQNLDETTRQLIMTSLSFVKEKQGLTLTDGKVTPDRAYIGMDAGYPHFVDGMGDWGRDTFISLPGLLLSTGRYEEAKKIILNYAGFVRHGMIPNLLDRGISPRYNTIDASLWYFQAIREYVRHVPNGIGILNEKVVKKYIRPEEGDRQEYTLWEILEEMMQSHIKGIEFQEAGDEIKIYMDGDDKLLAGGSPQTQLTWMDEKAGGVPSTPRNGKAVEINALWYNALKTMAELAEETGRQSGKYAEIATEARESFNRKFWYEDGGYFYDVIKGDATAKRQLRPNQLFAFSIRPELVPLDKKRRALEVIQKNLWTKHGLRTISQNDRQYRGAHEREKGSYHNGTVWPWLVGAFMDTYYDVYKDAANRNVKEEMREMLQGLVTHIRGNHLTVAEIFNGDLPNDINWLGTFSQAWSVAEILRISLTYLDGALSLGKTTGAVGQKGKTDEVGKESLSEEELALFILLVNETLKWGENILTKDEILSKHYLSVITADGENVRLKIAKNLETNSSHFYDPSKDEDEKIFSVFFVKDILKYRREYPLWAKAILFERLFHELGHTKSQGQNREAELVEYDINLIELYIKLGIQVQINNAFSNLKGKLNFRSGYYYYLLSYFMSIKDEFKRRSVIKQYLGLPKEGKEEVINESYILSLYPEEIAWVREHAKRVAELAEIIAKKMGLEGKIIKLIRLAGLAHDLGKGSSPGMIKAINDPTNYKAGIISVHEEEGLKVLDKVGIKLSDTAREAIRFHHEPSVLPDGDVKIAAEIIYVADQIEASQAPRPYPKKTPSLEILKRELLEEHKAGIISKNVYNAVEILFNKMPEDFKAVISETHILNHPLIKKGPGEKEIVNYILGKCASDSTRLPYIVGIAGGAGVWETTFANSLKKSLESKRKKVLVIGLDEFKKSIRVREEYIRTEWDERHMRLLEARSFMRRVKKGEKIIQRLRYDRKTGRLVKEEVNLSDIDIVIFEGLYTISNEERLKNLLEFVDLPIYMDAEIENMKKWRFKQENEKPHPRTLNQIEKHWNEGMLPDLKKNIQPQKDNAKVIIHKDKDHNMKIERKLYRLTIDETGKIINTIEIEKSGLYNEQYITDALGELVKKYGPGILSGIKEIEIVDRDGRVGSQADGKAVIDIDTFRNKNLVLEVLEHEAIHEILGLIIPDKPHLAEAIATWYSAERFAKLSFEEQKKIIELLQDKSNGLDPDGNYKGFLEYVMLNNLQGDRLIIEIYGYFKIRNLGLIDVWETVKVFGKVIKLFNDLTQANDRVNNAGTKLGIRETLHGFENYREVLGQSV